MSYQSLPVSMGILDFWFSPEVEPFWFVKDRDFDENLTKRFGKIYEEASLTFNQEKLDKLKSGEEALALVLIFDQLSRNMFRDTPKAFSTDDIALNISKKAVEKGLDGQLSSKIQRNFLYMPFMHSESLEDQKEGIRLFSTIPENEQTVTYAQQHKDIIARFGRFPHRNKVLGRISTADEVEFEKVFGGF